MPSYAVVSIPEMGAVDLPAGLRWHPIRPLLGVRAIGVSAYSAGEAGQLVVEPHDEASDGRGHEELYVVMRGAARFTLDGEELDAASGTLVLVRPGTHREAVATEPDTLVLAVGGPPTFEPAGSEWLELARPWFESDPDRAAALLDRGIEEIPSSAAIRSGALCSPPLTTAVRKRWSICGWRSRATRASATKPTASRSSRPWCRDSTDVVEETRAWRQFFDHPYQKEPVSRTPSASSCSIVLL